ncbi:MAG: GTP-binding protein [Desulfitobacterium hafniense]|nr:GTP-binding protein [Desulfitobacterium hafniense]
MEDVRETLRIVVVGHVDHGKSTVIGRLLYDTKSLPEGAIERVKRISKEKGKLFEYAYLLDAFEEEQKQGITIDTTQLQFHTPKRDYVIIDAPGHKEFLKNMISGAANAEAALLIIDANEGIQEQSKRHGYILSLLGIKSVYVVVNKMDLIDYSETKFNEIKHNMNEFLHNLHVYPLKYIPISAFYGENMTERSKQMPWYQGEPVLNAIDLFEKEKGLTDKPLRFPIQDVYKFDHRRIIAGRIESGTLEVGDEILITPGNKVTKVKTIEYWVDKDQKDAVSAGMSVGITLEHEFFNKRGEVITHTNSSPLVSDTFKANLFWMGRNPIVKGNKYKLKLVTQEVECEILLIDKVIDATTLAALEGASEVKTNDVAEVTIKTKQELSFDEFKNNQNTGRFVVVDGYDVSGGGIISGLVKGAQTASKFADENGEVVINIFDEYFYVLAQGGLNKLGARPANFSAGDALPIAGETYSYPEDFDVIDLKSKLVVKIRKAKLERLVGLNDYSYGSVPVIDTDGAYIKIESNQDFEKLVSEFSELDNGKKLAAFSNKWLDFIRFKRIVYKNSLSNVEIEYYI